jgi:hypothetical protein
MTDQPCKILDDHLFSRKTYCCRQCGRSYWEIMGCEVPVMQSKKDA